MLFWGDTPAGEIVIQQMKGVAQNDLKVESLPGKFDVAKVGQAIIPVVAVTYSKTLIFLGSKIAALFSIGRCASTCGQRFGNWLVKAGTSNILGNMLVGVGIFMDIVTIISTAISFNDPHVA